MEVQVDHQLYATMEYNEKGRFNSFWHQVNEVMQLKPENVLEIGTGNGIVNRILKDAGYSVATLDFDPALKPDYLGSVTAIPIEDQKFDAALCCQVLEHIPYDQFTTALREIHRVIKGHLILSLPDLHRAYRFGIQFPALGELKFIYSIPRLVPLKWEFNGEHYWNISCQHYPLRRIRKDIVASGFAIRRMYCVHEMPWHRFFILEKIAHPA